MTIDLVNMFNEISRDTIFKVVRERFPDIMPLVIMLYAQPGDVFFKWEDGSWRTERMEEGVNQGCPLSSILAALVLNEVLRPLTKQLNARAARRLSASGGSTPLDDNTGGQTHPEACVDDCGATVPLEDVEFFVETFNNLVWRIARCRLNRKKHAS